MSTTSSPFLNAESFSENGVHVGETPSVSSPFITAYVLESEDAIDPAQEARRLLLSELADDEFEAAIYELAGATTGVTRHADSAAAGLASLELEFAPLVREIDAMLARANERLGNRTVDSLGESELDEALAYRTSTALEPPMEHLFGSITRMVKKAMSGAASLAKRGLAAAASLGLGPIISRLRKAMPKLIRRLITGIINRLPASLQADARKLAAALPIPQSETGVEAYEKAFDAESIHDRFNEELADAVLATSGNEAETAAEAWDVPRMPLVGVHDLDAARERFVDQLSALQDGEDPTPAVEGFIPALIPVLKVAEKLAGRKRIVSLLSSMVSALISRFVGPQSAKALSTAMVDSGLKLVGLEVAPASSAAHQAIANTVEETVRRVAMLPDEMLDSRPLAEAAILREFEAAAAANFPPLLPARVYWRRPDLREADGHRGVWVASPAGRRRKRFKKYSHVVRARITPRMALAIRTFGETPLADHLNEQLGIEPGETFDADVHIYEAMPGMLLGEVGESEGESGLEDEFHPLTAEAASMLIGEPGLGQEGLVPLDARSMRVGQRFYRLALPQRRIAVVPGTHHRRRRTGVRLSIDTTSGTIVFRLFLSERRAQEIAKALRAKPHAGITAEGLRPTIDRWLGIVLSGRQTGRLRIQHAGLTVADGKGAVLKRVPPTIVEGLRRRLATSVLGGITEFLASQATRFIGATEDARDGVTVTATISGLGDVGALRAAIAGTGTPSGWTPAAAGAAKVSVDVTPGFAHG